MHNKRFNRYYRWLKKSLINHRKYEQFSKMVKFLCQTCLYTNHNISGFKTLEKVKDLLELLVPDIVSYLSYFNFFLYILTVKLSFRWSLQILIEMHVALFRLGSYYYIIFVTAGYLIICFSKKYGFIKNHRI